jgi:nicotinate-nucleotide pyrophosphorylase (carboxylating)
MLPASELSPPEQTACRQLIALALAEDLGERGGPGSGPGGDLGGDVTSQAVIPADLRGSAVFRAKAAGVLAGLPAAALVVQAIDSGVDFAAIKSDGDTVAPGDELARLAGSMRSILAAERTALNFLQHLSGIATLTRRFVDAVAGLPTKVLDTRKTLPGWRLLAKYAVRRGGGHNHRLGLHDGILIKDNHLAALSIVDPRSQIAEAVRQAKTRAPNLPVEIEVDSLEQLDAALACRPAACRPALVLLDNMTPELLREAVRRRDAAAPDVQLEASGGITLDTVRAVAETGVDRISIGALTHSAPALDVALDYQVP